MDLGISKRLIYLFLTILSLSWVPAAAAEEQIVLLKGDGKNTIAQAQLELATRFYGLRLQTVTVQSESDVTPAIEQLKDGETLGVVADMTAVQRLQKNQILSALLRPGTSAAPLLVIGVRSNTDSSLLQKWSDGGVSSCRSLNLGANKDYLVGSGEVARQLAGIRLPAVFSAECAFGLDGSQAKPLLSADGGQGLSPVFVRTAANSRRVFFLSDAEYSALALDGSHASFDDIFIQAAPLLMFVRFASGDYGWHGPGHYADLTIDDPWLREPYGFLNYENLWAEMQKHNFHTTIAFIPWNFDRSDPRLVTFFRNHTDRFSIAVHGDNHDHAEFATYDRKPLDKQITNIKQALARMKRFQELTGLHFDPVMVFPYEVVPPRPTLSKLNEYGFMAAPNATIVPSDIERPADPLFGLRAMSSDFGSFGLVRRYPAELHDPKALVAMHAFLDDPLLFYGHQDLFTDSIGAFNQVADLVNEVEPDTHWEGLGSAAQHLYLLRRKDDAHYEVRDYSSDFILENKSSQDIAYDVEKTEDGATPIQSVTVNGESSPYQVSGGYLRIAVLVPKGSTSHVIVKYQNDLDLAAVDISKKSLYVTLLRKASDFRDITFSKYQSGRLITGFYYKHNLNETEFELEGLLPALLFVLALSAAAIYWKKARSKRAGIPRLPNQTSL